MNIEKKLIEFTIKISRCLDKKSKNIYSRDKIISQLNIMYECNVMDEYMLNCISANTESWMSTDELLGPVSSVLKEVRNLYRFIYRSFERKPKFLKRLFFKLALRYAIKSEEVPYINTLKHWYKSKRK